MRRDSPGEQKGGRKGKALVSSLRVQGLASLGQGYLTAPCHTLSSGRRAHLHWLRWPHTRHSRNSFSVSFKNVCSDALQSRPSDIPCFDPVLTQELTLNCSMCRRGSKTRNFQTQKGEKLFFPTKKAEGGKKNNTQNQQTPLLTAVYQSREIRDLSFASITPAWYLSPLLKSRSCKSIADFS